MNATDIIGFTADADYYCSDCADRIYGPDGESRKDREGNDVHPIFASDETPANTVCSSCQAEITEPCDCSEEYGPCEMHGTVLAQREGSSSRSADELCVTFLEDAQGIDASCLSPYGLDVLARANAALEAVGPFSHWLEDAELGEELRDVVSQVENYLDRAGSRVAGCWPLVQCVALHARPACPGSCGMNAPMVTAPCVHAGTCGELSVALVWDGPLAFIGQRDSRSGVGARPMCQRHVEMTAGAVAYDFSSQSHGPEVCVIERYVTRRLDGAA